MPSWYIAGSERGKGNAPDDILLLEDGTPFLLEDYGDLILERVS